MCLLDLTCLPQHVLTLQKALAQLLLHPEITAGAAIPNT